MAFLRNHRQRTQPVKRYRQVADGSSTLAHRVRAERALGKPLPRGAVVHHADGTLSELSPLVICPNEAYHKALHVRMRVRAAGGNPWTDKVCGRCGARPLTAFSSPKHGYCRACDAAAHRVARA